MNIILNKFSNHKTRHKLNVFNKNQQASFATSPIYSQVR